MKNYFCTLLDHRYIDRGLLLYKSIASCCQEFTLWILCLNDRTYDILSSFSLKNTLLIRLSKLEDDDVQLKQIKTKRTPVSYYFTCKSSFTLYILNKFDTVNRIIYIDADMFFYASPEFLYPDFDKKSVAITPHRFDVSNSHLERYGKYNAGWLLFKRDKNGLDCLKWWRERCIEWCHDEIDDIGRYADQKYIDQFPVLFDGVWIIEHVGVNLAPWNIREKDISYINGRMYVDSQILICYHFHNLRCISKRRIFRTGCDIYGTEINQKLYKYIYKPYICELFNQRNRLPQLDKPLSRGKAKNLSRKRTLIERLILLIRILKGLKKRRYVIVQ